MAVRKEYDEELQKIYGNVRLMGMEIIQALDTMIYAFPRLDVDSANRIIANDVKIDQMESEIEEACIAIVVKQQPVASDWRRLASYMRMISDMERMSDNCSDISLFIKKLADMPRVPIPEEFQKMAETMRDMVTRTIHSFLTSDVELAEMTIEKDDIVDRDCDIIMAKIAELIKKEPDKVEQYLYYFLAAKYMERIADHAASIAAWIKFIVNGKFGMKYTDRYRNEAEKIKAETKEK